MTAARAFSPRPAAPLAFLLLGLLAIPANAFGQRKQPPAAAPVRYAIPAAAAPGATTEVKFFGPGVENATGLWGSFPAEAVRSGKGHGGEGGAAFRLTLPADVPVGIGAVRLATPAGATSFQLFMVDDLPSVPAADTNGAARDAQPLTLPVAVDGAGREAGFDYFKLAAHKGQRVSVEVVAQRLGSLMDPVARLLDGAGRELAWSDDAPGAGADCRFAHTFDADGDYLIELRDVNYEGGPDYRYRLRVGDFPLPVAAFPPAVKRGSTAKVTIAGDGCDGLSPVDVTVPADAGRVNFGVKRAGGQGSGFASVLAADADDVPETEPNDSINAATPAKKGATVAGRFGSPGDKDFYRFDAKKGNRILFRGQARSLGSPCELSLRLLKADGSLVAASKVNSAKPPTDGGPPPTIAEEGSLDATVPDDGSYLLVVEELNRGGGPGMVYRVEIEPVRPGFELAVETEKVDGDAGKSFTLKVTCTRRDFTGPVTLSFGGDAEGFGIENNVIGEGKTETQLKVKVPADVPPGRPLHFTVVGEARVADKAVRKVASTLPALRKLFPRIPYPPAELDGLIGLGVRAGDASR